MRPGAHAALAVDGDARGRAEPGVAEGELDREVHLGPGDGGDARGPGQAVLGGAPAETLQHAVATGDDADEVRHRRTGRETDVGGRGQGEQVEQPPPGGLLDRGRRGGREAEAGVLIPRAHEPVGGERGGQRPAHDPAEEPAGGDGHEAGLDDAHELVDDGGRVERLLLHRRRQLGEDLVGGRAERHGPGAERPQPIEGRGVCAVERPREFRLGCRHALTLDLDGPPGE